jgi:dihydroorotate dehydrogenase electron transfer subunit
MEADMGKLKMAAKVISQSEISKDIFSLVLFAPEIAKQARAGQFVSVYTNDKGKILPRPISLCEIDGDNGTLRLVYRIAGFGTKEFSKEKPGDYLDILGPLGNGFSKQSKRAILIGGGIGIPPMLQLAKELDCEKSIVLGYRDDLFLNEEFEAYGDVYLSSEDGKHGVKGNVIDAIKEYAVKGDVIYACGPTPMLKGIKAYAIENDIECQISMEEKMACGVGACLACVCKTKEIDEHSQVHNKRICADGPVFDAREVEL